MNGLADLLSARASGAVGRMESGLYSATTSATTAVQASSLTLTDIRAAMDRVKELEKEWERSFNATAQKSGFDLEKGDKMIVPKAFDMNLVPPRFRGNAVVAHEYATDVMFIKGAVLDPLQPYSRHSSPVWRMGGI